MNKFWKLIWNLSEKTGLGLGKHAPYVFGKIIGSKGNMIDSTSDYASEINDC